MQDILDLTALARNDQKYVSKCVILGSTKPRKTGYDLLLTSKCGHHLECHAVYFAYKTYLRNGAVIIPVGSPLHLHE